MTETCAPGSGGGHIPHNSAKMNQGLIYFIKMPQTGPRATSKYLNVNYLDLMNRSVKEFNTPSFNFSEILVDYGNRFPNKFTGDNFEVGTFTVTFIMDKDYIVYNTLLNWSLINMDVEDFGTKNPDFNQAECEGEVVMNFIDVGMKAKEKMVLVIKPLLVPEVTFSNSTDEELLMPVEFTVERLNVKEVANSL
jgi:hypothetical protein